VNDQAQFIRGTVTGAAVVALAGAAALACVFGWQAGAGFAVGALVSLGNFHLIARAVGGGLQGRMGGALWKGSFFRLGLAGAVLLGGLLVFRGSLPALVAGLLVTQITMIVLWLLRFRAAAVGMASDGAAAPRDPEAP
jgi:hypothetical protein